MNVPNSRKPAWEEWQLTAFVLGELDETTETQLQRAIESDRSLAAEVKAIRQTIAQVSAVYRNESKATVPIQGLGTGGLQAILQRADTDSSGMRPNYLAPLIPASDASAIKAEQPGRPIMKWLGLLAMSACLLIAVWLSVPSLSSWMLDHAESLVAFDTSESMNVEPASATIVTDGKKSEAQVATDNAALSRELSMLQTEVAANSVGRAASSPQTSAADSPLPDYEPAEMPDLLFEEPQFEQVLSTPQNLLGDEVAGQNSEGYAVASNEMGGRGGVGMGMGGMMGGMSMGMEGGMSMEGGGEMGGGEMGGDGISGGMMGGYGMGAGQVESAPALAVASTMGMTGGGTNHDPYSRGLEHERHWDDGLRRRQYAESSNNRFDSIVDNKFERVSDAPLSTFSIDVDTASYAKSRQLLMENNQLPPAGAVRIEEFINYFDYEYAGPGNNDPFAAHLAVASCPWRPEHKLVRIALQAPKVDLSKRPAANIVFLLDVSGSMDEANKLPLVKESLRMLIEQLGENDRIAMVVYAGAAGCVLESTRGDKQKEIMGALERLSAGGSTNGGDGIQLAYNIARDHYIPGGINRVILCTDGDFNVGVTSTQALVDLVVENAKSRTFLTVLGYGNGNTNDAMMEQISNQGNGVYAFVDSWREAKRQMVQQLAGNLLTVAKDVKIQVEFNPQQIQAYRLLGYENRIMAAEDFNNDQKDAGEIGAGHRVTALYEVVPLGTQSDAGRPPIDELRYQSRDSLSPTPTLNQLSNASETAAGETAAEFNAELLAVKLRYKQPEGDKSELLVFPLKDSEATFNEADRDFRWAASMAQFGMLLRNSPHAGNSSWSSLIEQAAVAAREAGDPHREEGVQMMRRAAQLRRGR